MNEMTYAYLKAELLSAKGKHLLFKSRLRAYVHDPTKVPEELLVNHLACDLGKWIESAKLIFDNLPSLIQLDQVHRELHVVAQEVVICKRARNELCVSERLKRAEGVMKEVVECIEGIEEEVRRWKLIG
jgi:hypothetical protein